MRCDDDEKEIYFSRKTKQLNFLIYIIRTWEIGRLGASERDECEIMLCQHYVEEEGKNLFRPFPMRQFDIASSDFISLRRCDKQKRSLEKFK